MKKMIKASNSGKITRSVDYLDHMCTMYGYKLMYAEWDENDLDVSIVPVDKFACDITVRFYKRDRQSGEIITGAQTAGFGSLNAKEYAEFARQVNNTNELIKLLNNFDFEALR